MSGGIPVLVVELLGGLVRVRVHALVEDFAVRTIPVLVQDIDAPPVLVVVVDLQVDLVAVRVLQVPAAVAVAEVLVMRKRNPWVTSVVAVPFFVECLTSARLWIFVVRFGLCHSSQQS